MGHIFISYSHKDKKYVEKLEAKLIEEGFNVWIDHRIDYGSQWPKEIQKQLDACEAFIVIVSENAYESEWVQNEVARAKRKKKPFFPLLLQGDAWLSVETIQYVDAKDGVLPPEKFYRRLEKATSREVIKTFNERAKRLLDNAIHSWVEFDLLPSPDTLFILWDELNHDLTVNEKAFLYCAYNSQEEILENWFEQNIFFSFDEYLDGFAKSSNISSKILSQYRLYSSLEWQFGTNYDGNFDILSSKVIVQKDKKLIPAFYCLITEKMGKCLEILVLQQENINTLIRYTKSNGREEREFFLSEIERTRQENKDIPL